MHHKHRKRENREERKSTHYKQLKIYNSHNGPEKYTHNLMYMHQLQQLCMYHYHGNYYIHSNYCLHGNHHYQVKLLVLGGLSPDDICVLSYYQKQVARIRQLLRNEKLRQVSGRREEEGWRERGKRRDIGREKQRERKGKEKGSMYMYMYMST